MARRIAFLSGLWLVLLFVVATVPPGLTDSHLHPTNATASPGNETVPTNATASPGNETLPTSATDSPGNVTVPTNATASPGNETLPTSATDSPGNVTVPTNSTASPGNGTVPPTTTPPPPNPCLPNPCGDGSTCQPRINMTFVCLCLPGNTYNPNFEACVAARVFPGTVETNQSYVDAMAVKTSEEFQTLSSTIVENMMRLLEGFEEAEPVVLELVQSNTVQGAVATRNTPTASAIVETRFPAAANITQEAIADALNGRCDGCVITNFTARALCDTNPCDAASTQCTDADGAFQCQCRDGFEKSNFTDRLCTAITCPSGERVSANACIKCSFGFTGVNCAENWKLILVIVGSALGGLLLISIILVAVFASKSSKKKSTRNINGNSSSSRFRENAQMHNRGYEDDEDTYTGNRLGNGRVPRIPRATTNDWGSRNNMEMASSSASNRGQNNPYSNNRPQINPYGESRGQTNSYYR